MEYSIYYGTLIVATEVGVAHGGRGSKRDAAFRIHNFSFLCLYENFMFIMAGLDEMMSGSSTSQLVAFASPSKR